MRRLSYRMVWRSRSACLQLCAQQRSYATSNTQDLIRIKRGTFYHEHPSATRSNAATNPPYFENLNFSLPASAESSIGKPDRLSQHWAVIGANDTTAFLDVLRGKLLCIPPEAQSYPHLSSDEIRRKDPQLSLPSRAIQYVGFNTKSGGGLGAGAGGVQAAYLSARYESRREETDWTVLQYLKGDTELNPSEELHLALRDDNRLLRQVIRNLRLDKLVSMPVANLSNGQSRRCRIAKSLLLKPELLLLDEPFMGLDPPTLVSLSPMLKELALRSSPLLVLGLRPQDAIPDWISHLVILGQQRTVSLMGPKQDVLFQLARWVDLNERGGLTNDAKLWVEFMNATHGQPLSGVGDSLSSAGVSSYETYKQALKQEKKYFDGVYVRPRALRWEKQKQWEAASSKSESKRTFDDWTVLLTSLPSDFESESPGAGVAAVGSRSILGGTKMPTSPTGQNMTSKAPRIKNLGEPLIELSDLVLKYGSKTILGFTPPQAGTARPGLNLTIRRGTRLALLGANGSGKTTLLSLLTSDHPQSYSLPIKFFGRSRLPSKGVPGLSLWDIQRRIGHSAPEVHAFFPKNLTIRKVLESSWAETYSSKPELNDDRSDLVDRFLRFWADELRPRQEQGDVAKSSATSVSWASSKSDPFSTLGFGTQRLLLLLRALIKQPDILVLDEAFSGLSAKVRDKALLFLEKGELSNVSSLSRELETPTMAPNNQFRGLTQDQAMIVVSHLREEIPYSVDEWIRLPSEEEATELGRGVETGTTGENHGIRDLEGWNTVWRM